MPPEPTPWGTDRKDTYKERKHERSDFSPYPFGPPHQHHQYHQNPQHKWRDMSSSPSGHYGSSRYGGSNDFRRPFGHGKQGGRHLYSEEPGRGYVPSRSVDKMLEEENCWPSVSRRDGKYGSRYNRDNNNNYNNNRGSFSQRTPKGPPWEMSNGYSNTTSQINDVIGFQRLGDDMLTSPPSNPPHSNHANSWEHSHLKGQRDNNLKTDGVNGLNTGDKGDWKVLKWSRSGSLSSRGSGFSHSSSSKSLGVVDSSEAKIDLQIKDAATVQSPSGDGTACVTSVAPSEEMISRKKPRLGWGEGLAKYEKKKVEGPDLSFNKVEGPDFSANKDECPDLCTHKDDPPILSANKDEGPDFIANKDESPDLSANKGDGVSTCNVDKEMNCQSSSLAEKSPRLMASLACASPGRSNADNEKNCLSSSLAEKSPRLLAPVDCASPATPSSVACSSSPGVGDKALGKVVNIDNNAGNLCGSPIIGSQGPLEGFSFNLENLDLNSMANLNSLLSELLHSDDSNVAESCFVKSTAMSKLLIWKGDVSKALEATETEIDLLENELKVLKSESKIGCPRPAASSSIPAEVGAPSKQKDDSTTITRPSILQVSYGDETGERKGTLNNDLEDAHARSKDDNIDSPGTATSKFVELISLAKEASSLVVKNGQCAENTNVAQPISMDLKCVEPCLDVDELIVAQRDSLVLQDAVKDKDDSLCTRLLTANKESAHKAVEAIIKLLPRSQSKVDSLGVMNALSWQADDLVREKIARRKHFMRFKERMVALKFRAFQHMWKEDMRLLSLRRHNTKSLKKGELNLRISNSGLQKHRSSIRPRFTSSSNAGNISLVPTTEILNFVSNSLSDTEVKHYRNALKMPSFILDKKERVASHFLSNNGLVEDPCAVEKERAMINPWSAEEREIFMEKFATFGKDFRKIASFLGHKTTGDCVEFYYKNHKSDSFEKTKKIKQAKSSSNYMVPSGNKWNREMNSASLDILGAASVVVNNSEKHVGDQHISSGRLFLGGCGDDGIVERKTLGALGNYREAVAADVLAGICASVSSEAMSSCISTTLEPVESYRGPKSQKLGFITKWPSTSDVTENADEETCSDESCGEMDAFEWTDEEKSLFLQAVSSYGKDFGKISRCVRTRSRDQCKVFFSKARKCLGLDLLCPQIVNLGTLASYDANGGGGGGEDACTVEAGSVVSNDEMGSRMEKDVLLHVMNSKEDEFHAVQRTNLQTEIDKSENKMEGQSEQEPHKVVETSHSDASCHMEHHPPAIADGSDGKVVNTLIGKATCMDDQKLSDVLMKVDTGTQHIATNVISAAESASVVDEVTPCHPSDPNAVVESSAVREASSKGNLNDLQAHDRLPSEKGSSGQNGLIFHSNTTLDLGTRQKLGQESNSKVDHLQLYSVNQNGFPEFTVAYPMLCSTKIEMNGDIAHRPLSEGQSHQNKQFDSQSCYLQKCVNSLVGVPISAQHGEHPSEQSTDRSGGLPDVVKPCRNGDFKLFGRILSTPASTRELHSSSTVNEDEGTGQNKSKSSILDFKAGVVNFDKSNCHSIEEAPVMCYSFGDVPRLQAGFPPEPESTKLLSKYPDAFNNRKLLPSNMQQHPLQGAVIGSNDHSNVNGIPIFHPMGISVPSNGMADYPNLPTFIQQRRNGYEAVHTLHHGNGHVGVNYVGRGGTRVAGPCTGVLDPVTALQMELAKAKQYGLPNGTTTTIIREEEPWRSKDSGR